MRSYDCRVGVVLVLLHSATSKHDMNRSSSSDELTFEVSVVIYRVITQECTKSPFISAGTEPFGYPLQECNPTHGGLR